MNRTIAILVILLSCGVCAAESPSRVSFTEKLRAMEDSKRQEQKQIVNTYSDSEYRAYKHEQLMAKIKPSEKKKASIIIDVSDMGDPGTLAKSSRLSLGVMKLDSIVSKFDADTNSKGSDASPKIEAVNMQWAFSNTEESKKFEQIGVSLNQAAALWLINHPDVKDVLLKPTDTGRNLYSAINTEKARFFPLAETPVYDPEFLKEGFYSELLDGFKEKDSLFIFVRLKGEPVEWQDRTPETNRFGLDLVASVLSEIGSDQFELERKSPFSFLIKTNKVVAQQLFEDPRVLLLSDYAFNESRVKFGIAD